MNVFSEYVSLLLLLIFLFNFYNYCVKWDMLLFLFLYTGKRVEAKLKKLDEGYGESKGRIWR